MVTHVSILVLQEHSSQHISSLRTQANLFVYSPLTFSPEANEIQTTTRSTITGPEWKDGNVYTKEDSVESTVVIWSPCGDTGILNVNNRISLSANSSSGTGELSDDDATVSFDQKLLFQWQPCVE